MQSGLAKLSGFTGLDMGQYPMDEPFKFDAEIKEGAISGVIKNFNGRFKDSKEVLTPRKIGKMAGFVNTPAPVGTASMVADVFEEWMQKTDCDGFNLVCEFVPHSISTIFNTNLFADVSNPTSYEDIVELLVPELQKRDLMFTPIPNGTYRENLHNTPGEPYLNARHPGSKFKWNAPKPGNGGSTLKAEQTT